MFLTQSYRRVLFILIMTLIIGGYFLGDRFTMVTALGKLKSGSLVSCHNNLEDVLKVRSTNNRIVVTMLNYAYVKLVFHWIFRLQRMGVTNFFIYILDKKTADFFQESRFGHLCYFSNSAHIENVSSQATPGSAKFKLIGNNKMFLLYRILQLNYSVLMSEIDVVWIDDPRSRLIELSKDFDTISQGLFYADANNRRNIGFFYLPARPIVLEVMKDVTTSLREKPTLWDQGVFNQVVDRLLHEKRIRDIILDRFIYMFEPFFMDPNLSLTNVSVAHLVGVDSAADKTFVIKERSFSEDAFGYLSDKRKYLTYDNPSIDPLNQVILLKKALFLSKILNRTLILPRFHCKHIGHHNQFHQVIMSSNCTAERFVDIEYLDANYQIRESSFLNNPFLPVRVHNDLFVYNVSCEKLNGLDNNVATLIHIVNMNCSNQIEENPKLKLCPPSPMHSVVLGYGPICR